MSAGAILLMAAGKGGTEGATQVSLTQTVVEAPSSGASQTIPNVGFGAAAPDRILVFMVTKSNGGALSSATIGGQTCTLIATVDSGLRQCHMFYAGVPTGTSGSLTVVTASGVAEMVLTGVFRIVAQEIDTPNDFYANTNGGGQASISGTIDCPADGVIVGFFHNNDTGTTTWTQLTENDDQNDGSRVWSSASKAYASAQTNLAIQATPSTSATKFLLMASWG